MSSSTTNSAMNHNNNDRKRSDVSLANTKKLRRSELVKISKDVRPSRSSSVSDSLTKINDITQEYSLPTDSNLNNRSLTLRPLSDSYDNNSNKRDIGSNENLSSSINKKSTAFSLIVKPSTINKQDERKTNLVPSYDSDEELDKTKQNTNKILPMVVASIITSSDLTKKSRRPDNNVIIQQMDGKSNIEPNSSTKLLKLVVPQSMNSSSAIKMLSHGDGLSSALRIPTRIQLTKTLSVSSALIGKQRSVDDYPPTPPPPIVDNRNANFHTLYKANEQDPVKKNTAANSKGIEGTDASISNEHQTISKRHLSILSDWSVPPTSELSPTSLTSSSPDLSQNHLTPEDSFIELDIKLNQSSIKRRYRSLSSSCPVLPYYDEKIKPITPPYKSKSLSRISNSSNKKVRSMSPVIKYSSLQRLKKRRNNNQFYAKRSKLKTKNDQENIFIIEEILNDMIEQVESINNDKDNVLKILLNTPVSQVQNTILINNKIEESRSTMITQDEFDRNEAVEHMDEMNHQEVNNNYKTVLRQSKLSTHDEDLSSSSNDPKDTSPINPFSIELKRQTSTPLSFHSIPSSSADEQSIISPHSQSVVSKTHIFTDIVNELIKGAKGLDKLSCSLITFTNSIHDFIRLPIEKQTEKVEHLQRELEKKCSSQLNRANIFCTQKIQYFINKHSIISNNEHIDGVTLIVKYFYLHVLSLNCRKQENEVESILNDLINEKLTFINESFQSSILTTIIEDLILTSTLANDYLISQPIVINQIEYSLPYIRNIEFENELLYKNEQCLTINPFSDSNDLEDYLNRCEHMSTAIPYYPVQQPSHPAMYYSNYSHPSASAPYNYPPTQSTDMTPYYYPITPNYSNSQQSYAYNHSSSYYHPLASYGTPYNNNEQYSYYYNQQTSYSYSHPNSTNDIPLSNNHSNHQSYRQKNANMQRKYSNLPPENLSPMTPTAFDTSNVDSPQSKSTSTPNNIYPS